ncbi:hypothetical protein GQ42DRAFT_2698 [Ramicandelaber brevisporus]|nr:hypothetical protein GQ42DRAFT_2698 [Ramicandelaber brevisporus]
MHATLSTSVEMHAALSTSIGMQVTHPASVVIFSWPLASNRDDCHRHHCGILRFHTSSRDYCLGCDLFLRLHLYQQNIHGSQGQSMLLTVLLSNVNAHLPALLPLFVLFNLHRLLSAPIPERPMGRWVDVENTLTKLNSYTRHAVPACVPAQ